jgi:thiamine pyrophosphate-dependent acetolactate synthase large subunit-like protein
MNSLDALRIILPILEKRDIALFTTGFICRHAFSFNDRKANFYMTGSMGLVSSVGLGIALNSTRRVFIFDGDGSVLMDMGSLAMIAVESPDNLFHIVLDNEVYESTGRQPSLSRRIDLSRVAQACGYKKIYNFSGSAKLQESIGGIMSRKGPVFIMLKLYSPSPEKEMRRVSVTPEALTQRIRRALLQEMDA